MLNTYSIQPLFTSGIQGKLYALHYAPSRIDEVTECFIVAPPFAEEMNRCRYMSTMLAQSLGENGYGYLSVDSYGTGDSEGDFAESNWELMSQDLLTAIDYAYDQGYGKIALLGIRLGALQVMKIANSIEKLHRILFWQPVTNGQATLTEFLRIRIAASMNRNEKAGTIKEFEEQIERGKSVQVGGYDVSPGLFKGIKSAKFEDYFDLTTVPIGWFTALASAIRKPPRTDTMKVDKWRAKGAIVDYFNVIGPPYWQAHERTLLPELIEETISYIKRENSSV